MAVGSFQCICLPSTYTEKVLTSTVLGLKNMHNTVTSHHASVIYMMILDNVTNGLVEMQSIRVS